MDKTTLTIYYTEDSMSDVVSVPPDTNLGIIREIANTTISSRLAETWGMDPHNVSLGSITITSDTHGSIACRDDTTLAKDLPSNNLTALISPSAEAPMTAHNVPLRPPNPLLMGHNEAMETLIKEIRDMKMDMGKELKDMQTKLDRTNEWVDTYGPLVKGVLARDLLTTAQTKLALAAGIVKGKEDPSLAWRRELHEKSQDLSVRVSHARTILGKASDPKVQKFVKSDPGMRVVCEHPSPIHIEGNKAAHTNTTNAGYYHPTLDGHGEAGALEAMLDLTCL